MKRSSPPPFCQNVWICMLSWMCSSWLKFYYQRVRCSGQGVGLTVASAWRFWWRIGSGRPSNFFLRKKGKKRKKSRVTSLPSPSPQKSSRILASLSPASHLKWNQGKESFLRTRTKQSSRSIYDQPRKFHASARDSAMVSASDREFTQCHSPFNLQFRLFF